MDYQEKIFILQPDSDDTDLAVCRFDKKTGQYKKLHKVTESRYRVMMTPREYETYKILMAHFIEEWNKISMTEFFQFEYDVKKIGNKKLENG